MFFGKLLDHLERFKQRQHPRDNQPPYVTAGIYLASSGGSVTNTGTIVGNGVGSAGVFLPYGGTVNNESGGIISSADWNSVFVGGGGVVTNAGEISGSTGVDLSNGGSVNNHRGGKISGGEGVFITFSSGMGLGDERGHNQW